MDEPSEFTSDSVGECRGSKNSGEFVFASENARNLPKVLLSSASCPYNLNSTWAHAAPRAPQSKRPSHTGASYELTLTEPVTL